MRPKAAPARRPGRRLAGTAVLLAVLAGTALAARRLESLEPAPDLGRELLYLPNGRALRVASLGHGPLLADLIYLWAIQYYSNYERSHRHRWVEHVFRDVITELDPHYVDPYWLGALILIVEGGDLEAGLALLDKGFENNPERWIFPYFAGWEAARAGRYELAATYFDRAASVRDAPPIVLRARAGMFVRAGDYDEAIRHWLAVLDDPRSDETSRRVARRQIRDLRVRADVARLEAALERFESETGRLPRRLTELVARGYLDRVPTDPDDEPYEFDPRTGRVSSAGGRVLGGS